MNWERYFIAASIVMTIFISLGNMASGEKCEDIKYEDDPLKMPGTSHDDNKPSESEFKDKIFEESATLCEVAHCYDNNECKGELDEDDRDEFESSIAYEGTSDEQQKCLDYRYDLPDGGDEALQAYELFDCAVGNY